MKKQCSNCKEDDKNSIYLVEILHKPISPYFSSYYSGIISIVCGTTMAFVFDKIYSFLKQNRISFKHGLIIWEFLIIITCIAIIWHSYMKITQYKAWPLNIIDTILPALYSIVIYLLVYFIYDIGVFALMFSFLCGIGAYAYWNTLIRMQKKEAKYLYEIHFHKYSPAIHNCIFRTVYSFALNSFLFYSQICIIFFIMSMMYIILTSCQKQPDNELSSFILCFLMSATSIYAFMHDLNKELRKIECLSKYF